MTRWMWGLFLGVAMAGAARADAPGDARERAEIAAAKRAAEAQFQAAEAACRERFVVTPCIEDARAERRRQLALLRDRELKLDDHERRHRAAQRGEAVARKQAAAASAAASAASAASAPRASSSAAARAPSSSPPRLSGEAASAPRSPLDGSAEAAAARAARSAQRQQEAQARRERIEAREAERRGKAAPGSADEKKSAPLPKP